MATIAEIAREVEAMLLRQGLERPGRELAQLVEVPCRSHRQPRARPRLSANGARTAWTAGSPIATRASTWTRPVAVSHIKAMRDSRVEEATELWLQQIRDESYVELRL